MTNRYKGKVFEKIGRCLGKFSCLQRNVKFLVAFLFWHVGISWLGLLPPSFHHKETSQRTKASTLRIARTELWKDSRPWSCCWGSKLTSSGPAIPQTASLRMLYPLLFWPVLVKSFVTYNQKRKHEKANSSESQVCEDSKWEGWIGWFKWQRAHMDQTTKSSSELVSFKFCDVNSDCQICTLITQWQNACLAHLRSFKMAFLHPQKDSNLKSQSAFDFLFSTGRLCEERISIGMKSSLLYQEKR